MIINNFRKRLFRALVAYSLDMSVAIAGWTYGFGLEVKNWFALIFLCIFVRLWFHLFSVVIQNDDAKNIDKNSKNVDKS